MLRTVACTLLLCAAVFAQQYLPTATFANNAPEASAYAFLPFAGVASEISGRFDFQSRANGSTEVTFLLSNIPTNASYPLSYFIATNGVPLDGDCYLTGPTFDPAGSLSYCNRAFPQACKVGDLSGKSFNLTATTNSSGNDFYDDFLSFSLESTEYFVNRSIVLSDSTGSRLACTNITSVSTGAGKALGNATQPSPVTYAQVYGIEDNSCTTTPTSSSAACKANVSNVTTATSGAKAMSCSRTLALVLACLGLLLGEVSVDHVILLLPSAALLSAR